MTNELRAKFELWATVKRRYNLERHPLRHDEYNYTSTDLAWEAWQAAHASQDTEVEALKLDAERYRKLLDLLDEAEPVSNEASTIRNIIDDAINLGSGCMNLHLDAAMREGE